MLLNQYAFPNSTRVSMEIYILTKNNALPLAFPTNLEDLSQGWTFCVLSLKNDAAPER